MKDQEGLGIVLIFVLYIVLIFWCKHIVVKAIQYKVGPKLLFCFYCPLKINKK